MGLLVGLFSVVQLVLQMIQLVIFASVIASWFDADPRNKFVSMIHTITEPIYRLVRPLTNKIPGPFDWAPMVILLIIVFIQKVVGYYSIHLGYQI